MPAWPLGNPEPVHWSLDVVFHEDDSRIRKGHAPENMTVMRKLALNLARERVFQGVTRSQTAQSRMGQ